MAITMEQWLIRRASARVSSLGGAMQPGAIRGHCYGAVVYQESIGEGGQDEGARRDGLQVAPGQLQHGEVGAARGGHEAAAGLDRAHAGIAAAGRCDAVPAHGRMHVCVGPCLPVLLPGRPARLQLVPYCHCILIWSDQCIPM